MSDREERLRDYAEMLLKWSAKINLVGPEAKRNLAAHIAEAVRAAEELKPEGEVLDFGSGGGLPAIPMSIAFPRAHFHLVEADQKKWAFLKHAVRELSLNCVVHGDRLARVLERIGPDLRFELVTSRAVGNPEEWLPSLWGHLISDGRVALFQTSPAPPEVPGYDVERTVALPRGESNHLVVLRKVPRGTWEK